MAELTRLRLRYLCIPLFLVGFGAWFYAGLVYPFWMAVGTGAALLVASIILALFVWPQEAMRRD